MKKIITITYILLYTSIYSAALTVSDTLSIEGTYFGIFNSIETRQSQFDFATNLDFNYIISKELKGIIQLQGGNGDGNLGFVGPGIDVTDISVEYTPNNQDLIITLGSFDTPFGNETNYLTNNGDNFNQLFVLNNLVYSAFAGPVGTLNTLGVKLDKDWGAFNTILSVSNGTGETAINEGNTFETLLQVSTDTIIDNLKLTGTVMQSDDQSDSLNESNTSFEADLTGGLLEAEYKLSSQFIIKLNYGALNYGDNDSSTSDQVTIYGMAIEYFNNQRFAGIRGSFWTPEDANGDNTGVSTVLATPGLSTTTLADVSIARYQATIGQNLNEQTKIVAEYIYDNYSSGNDISAFISGININF